MSDDQQGAPPARRGRGTTTDMVRSLAVIFAIVAAVLILMPRPKADTVRTVDWRPFAQQAAGAATYDVLEPAGLPPGWRSTSARAEDAPGDGSVAWSVGFVTPRGAYAALAQSDGDTSSFVADFTKQGSPAASVTVDGQRWEQRERRLGREDRRSLVREASSSVVIVTGTAEWPELEELAAALRPSGAG